MSIASTVCEGAQNGSISNEYTAVANGQGDFVVTNLPKGYYKATITYVQQEEDFPIVIEYKQSISSISVAKNTANEQIDNLKNIMLTIDTDRLVNPLAKVTVEREKVPLKGAKVFLYASETAMNSDSLKGLTSVASGVTNHRGIVLFPDLEDKTYYINSQAVIGQDTLNQYGENRTICRRKVYFKAYKREIALQ